MKGILFKPDVWKAKLRVLEDHGEAETRRAEKALGGINKDPDQWECQWLSDIGILACRHRETYEGGYYYGDWQHFKPRYQVGEVVYVKETWAYAENERIIYKSSESNLSHWEEIIIGKWHSPMMMPEWAARYFIRILDVKVERLQEISEKSCQLEGIDYLLGTPETYSFMMQNAFAQLWNSINPQYPWDSNPWEFAYRFKLEKA